MNKFVKEILRYFSAFVLAGMFLFAGIYSVVFWYNHDVLAVDLTWSTKVLDTSAARPDLDYDTGQGMNMVMEDSDTIHFIFNSRTSKRVNYRKYDAGVYTAEDVDSIGSVYTSDNIDLTLDSSNIPVVIYGDNSSLYYYTRNGAGTGNCDDNDWNYYQIKSGTYNFGKFVHVASYGNSFGVSFYDVLSSQLIYGQCSSDCQLDTSWSFESVESDGVAGGHNDITFDNTGIPVISYTNITSGTLKYAIRNGGGSGNCIGVGGSNEWNCYEVDTASGVITDYSTDVTTIDLDSNNNIGISYINSNAVCFAYNNGITSGCSTGISGWECDCIPKTASYAYEDSSFTFRSNDDVPVFFYEKSLSGNEYPEFAYRFNDTWVTSTVYGVNTLDLGFTQVLTDGDNIFAAFYEYQTDLAGINGGEAFFVTSTLSLNTAPTSTITSATERRDGTGLVDISATVDDDDDDDLKLKIEYESDGDGACDGPWASATVTSTVSVTYQNGGSDPDVDNAETYQIGTNTAIITSSGVNTLDFVWDSQADIPTASSTYCLRTTVNDGSVDQDVSSTSTLTVDNYAPVNLADLAVATITTSSFKLTWTTSTDTNWDDATTTSHYEIWFTTTNSSTLDNRDASSTEWDASDDSNLMVSSTASTTITGLDENTEYFFKIWAVDDYGNEASIIAISSVTLLGAPTSLSSSALTATSVILTASIFNQHDAGSSGYFFSLFTYDDYTAVADSGWQSGDETWEYSSLSADTHYLAELKYRDQLGTQTATTSLDFYTLASDLSSVSAIVNSAGTPTSEILLSWTGDATLFYAEASLTSNFASVASTYGWTADSSHVFSDLESDTTYYFRVKAKNAVGVQTTWSSAVSAKTDAPAVGSGPSDNCPADPNKTSPGICGCGVPDIDSDGDGVMNCVDNCPDISNSSQTDTDGNGVGDDCEEEDPNNPSALVLINNGAKYTNNPNVLVNFNTDFVDQYALPNENGTYDGVVFQDIVSQLNYTFDDTEGEKRFDVRFKNSSLNYDAHDVIILDKTAPIFAGDNIDRLSTQVKANLVANLKFNEGSGSTASDSTGNGNSGTIVNSTWLDSAIANSGLKFTNNNSYVKIANSDDINLGTHQQRSISVWFKAQNKDLTQKQVIFEEGAQSRGMNIYLDSGQIYFGGWNAISGESNWTGTWLSSPNIQNNRWHHAVITLNGFSKIYPESFKAYLDGELVGSGEGSQLWGHTGDISIGRNGGTKFHDGEDTSVGEYFTGSIDELAIFNDNLSETEVKTLFSSLVAHAGTNKQFPSFTGKVSDEYPEDVVIKMRLIDFTLLDNNPIVQDEDDGTLARLFDSIKTWFTKLKFYQTALAEDTSQAITSTTSPDENGEWKIFFNRTTEPGIYTVEIQAIDGAGNASPAYTQDLALSQYIEYCGDGIDNNGNDMIDEGCYCDTGDNTDPDGDGIDFYQDNCPCKFNPGQEDGDKDGIGDACDNCSDIYNPAQVDYYLAEGIVNDEGIGDGIGDACQVSPEDFACDTIPYVTFDISRVENSGEGDAEEKIFIGNSDYYSIVPGDTLYLRNNSDPNNIYEDMKYDSRVNQNVKGMAVRRGPGWFSVVLYGHHRSGTGKEIMDVDFVLHGAEIIAFEDINIENQGDFIFTDNAGQDEVYFYSEGIVDGQGQGDNTYFGGSSQIQTRLRVTTSDDEFYVKYRCVNTNDPDPKEEPDPEKFDDTDNDGVIDIEDNCARIPNPDQLDSDGDGIGDVCDNCIENANPNQSDQDSDNVGDLCDTCALDPDNDIDDDGICGDVDNCVELANADQTDTDNDGIGDVCDISECYDPDGDSYGVGDACSGPDECPNDANKTLAGVCGCGTNDTDSDGDGTPDCLDKCPSDANKTLAGACGCGVSDTDSDGDGIPDCNDNDECVGDDCNVEPKPCVGDECNVEPKPCIGPDCGGGNECVGPNCGTSGGDKIINSIVNAPAKIIQNVQETFKKASEKVRQFFAPMTESFAKAGKVIQEKVLDNPQVEEATRKYVAPATAAVGVANMAVGFQLPQLLALLRSIFAQPLLFLRLRKRKDWGVVYDSFTKQPISLATVRLINKSTGKVVMSQVTDSQGRYLILPEPGNYRLEIKKDDYAGFSEYLAEKTEDAKFTNLYHGGDLNISGDEAINYAVPLDPVDREHVTIGKLKDQSTKIFQNFFAMFGLVVAVLSFVITPTAWIAFYFFLHLLFFALFYKLSHLPMTVSWGIITDESGKKPIDDVLVRVFDSTYNRLVESGTTDRKGRYAILVGPAKYFVKYTKEGFQEKQTQELDYSSQKTDGMGGVISRKEKLEEKDNN